MSTLDLNLAKRTLLLSSPDTDYEAVAQRLASMLLSAVADHLALVDDIAHALSPEHRSLADTYAKAQSAQDQLRTSQAAYETLTKTNQELARELGAIHERCSVPALEAFSSTADKVEHAIRAVSDAIEYTTELRRFARANQAMLLRVTNRSHCAKTIEASASLWTCGLVAGHDGPCLAEPQVPSTLTNRV